MAVRPSRRIAFRCFRCAVEAASRVATAGSCQPHEQDGTQTVVDSWLEDASTWVGFQTIGGVFLIWGARWPLPPDRPRTVSSLDSDRLDGMLTMTRVEWGVVVGTVLVIVAVNKLVISDDGSGWAILICLSFLVGRALVEIGRRYRGRDREAGSVTVP